ncbi:ketosynthase chain-length factor [Streptomyces sp. Ncost-T10-10d]|uniref:ketosynthase chain-length factor n=1 Tax=Streptomyces sp. Ncost-T10-10d TaxID=1839774 RepID=UPI00081D9437|nr:ketosynthase chain-length factor [Streptomyces sp. Ncost-T10-10d]SCF79743.1 act minimal PKS chain-length factor (CLF/KS beta) [Streptomyces sp. Ncost-T10-10d]
MSASAPVITGVGVVAPNGLDREAWWQATLDGKSGLGRISRFDPARYPVRIAGEATGFEAADHAPPRLVSETDAMTQYAFAATNEALADAVVDPDAMTDLDMAVITANSSGGVEFGQRELQKLYSEGPQAVGAYMSIAWFYAATTGQLSIRHGMRGPCGVLCSEQAGGLDVLAQARRVLAKGTRLVLSGGTDASLSPYGLVCQLSTGRLSEEPRSGRAYVPFDRAASGYVPGEGGAILVVESHDEARARGAERIYGEIAGYAATFDPRPGSGRPPGLLRAAELALADAGTTPAEIDVVFADGHGLPELDRQEAEAINAVFGPGGVPVSVPKTMTGRLYAGGAALDVAAAVLALRDQVIPPSVNARPDPVYRLDLVTDRPREAGLRTALVLARGYGGFNAAVVLRSV